MTSRSQQILLQREIAESEKAFAPVVCADMKKNGIETLYLVTDHTSYAAACLIETIQIQNDLKKINKMLER